MSTQTQTQTESWEASGFKIEVEPIKKTLSINIGINKDYIDKKVIEWSGYYAKAYAKIHVWYNNNLIDTIRLEETREIYYEIMKEDKLNEVFKELEERLAVKLKNRVEQLLSLAKFVSDSGIEVKINKFLV